jgi:hypothetical protein
MCGTCYKKPYVYLEMGSQKNSVWHTGLELIEEVVECKALSKP